MFDQSEAIARLTQSPLFPFEGSFRLKSLRAPMAEELQRDGEGDKPCHSCDKPERILWSNDRWKITGMRPSANPVGPFLETIDHIDFEHFDDQLAAEYGVLSRHLESAIRTLDSVGRVHIHRFGDGSSHFHVWFLARAAGQLELYGWGNTLWSQLIEPIDESETRRNERIVASKVHAAIGGRLP